MKKLFILIISFAVVVFANSCREEIKDITQYQWKLRNITVENKMSPSPVTYTLWFHDDSTFVLNLSKNEAMGKYRMDFPGNFTVTRPHYVSTRVCCDSEYDSLLMSSFLNVNSYTVKGEKLRLKGII